MRGRAEGQKTVFVLPSLSRKRFDVESSSLNQFVAKRNPNLISLFDLTYCAHERAEGALFTQLLYNVRKKKNYND